MIILVFVTIDILVNKVASKLLLFIHSVYLWLKCALLHWIFLDSLFGSIQVYLFILFLSLVHRMLFSELLVLFRYLPLSLHSQGLSSAWMSTTSTLLSISTTSIAFSESTASCFWSYLCCIVCFLSQLTSLMALMTILGLILIACSSDCGEEISHTLISIDL